MNAEHQSHNAIKIAVFMITVWLFIFASKSLATTAEQQPVLPIQHWQTKTGTPVLFVRTTTLPILDVAVTFAAGSAHDGKQYGLAYLVNHMLDEGAGKLSANQIAERFDAVGAHFSVSVNRDMATVTLRTLTTSAALQQSLATFFTVLSAPTFPQKNFTRLKNQLLLALKREQQLPNKVASLTFFKALYGSSPYGHPVNGTQATVKKMSAGNLQRFYRRFYVAQNAQVVIVGNISREQAEKIATDISVKLPRGKHASAIKTLKMPVKPRTIKINFPSQQTHLMMGEIGITRKNPDYLALKVANYILGGGPMVSRLFQTIREQQGLAYAVESHFYPWQQPGPLLIAMQTRNRETTRALMLTRKTLEDFANKGITAKELRQAKKFYLGSFPLYFASNRGIAANLINMSFYHLPLDYLDTYRTNIQALTLKTVNAAIKKYIQPDRMQTIMVGDFKQ